MTVDDPGHGTDSASTTLVSVESLVKWFPVRRTPTEWARRTSPHRAIAVDDVSLALRPGEQLGIVGESGSGKSTLARCLVRLYRPSAGRILFRGVDIGTLQGESLKNMRRSIQMIFQDPFTSLNPFHSVGSAISEAGAVHGRTTKGNEKEFVQSLLEIVGLDPATASRRPAELSGGQRQRVAIARALAVQPELIIADEAVSSLDVSIQAQILTLFMDLHRRLGVGTVFISHDLAVVSQVSELVAVMYLGRIVEYGKTRDVFQSPQHPYTKGLLESHPEPDPSLKRARPAVIGELPSPLAIPSGCRFRTRCAFAHPECAVVDPSLEEVRGRLVACHVKPFANDAYSSDRKV